MTEYTFNYSRLDRTKREIVARTLGVMGNIKAASMVSSAMLEIKPHIVVLVGLAGGLNADAVSLGDVLISSAVKVIYPDKVKSIDASTESFVDAASNPTPGADGSFVLDNRKRFMSSSYFRYRRDAVYIERSLHKANRYATHLTRAPLTTLIAVNALTVPGLPTDQISARPPRVSAGAVFGSDMVLDSEEFIRFIEQRNMNHKLDYYVQKTGVEDHDRSTWFDSDLPAVDMETFGFLHAVQALETHFPIAHAFSVRGISDMARNKQVLDTATADGVRRIAVRNAVTVALDLLDYLDRQGL